MTMYVATEPGGSTVLQVICDPQPGDFVGHYTYFPVTDWRGRVPQVGWVRNPSTGTIAPPVRIAPLDVRGAP